MANPHAIATKVALLFAIVGLFVTVVAVLVAHESLPGFFHTLACLPMDARSRVDVISNLRTSVTA